MEHPVYNGYMERFWSKVQMGAGCWEWRGARFKRSQNGALSYGMFWWQGRAIQAHRLAWTITNGSIPAGVYVCHHCDNQGCVRPDHLYLGTHTDNTRDAIARHRMHEGEQIAHHKLTVDSVRAIRVAIATGEATERIGPRFGVSGRTVRFIRDGRRWASVQ